MANNIEGKSAPTAVSQVTAFHKSKSTSSSFPFDHYSKYTPVFSTSKIDEMKPLFMASDDGSMEKLMRCIHCKSVREFLAKVKPKDPLLLIRPCSLPLSLSLGSLPLQITNGGMSN